jgi:hypothetical protein
MSLIKGAPAWIVFSLCLVLIPSGLVCEETQQTAQDNLSLKAQREKVLELKHKIIELQNKGKLGFNKVALCSRVDGFGQYSPLKPGVKTSGLTIYFEPANVSILRSGERYVIDCKVDIAALSSTGKVLALKKNMSISKVTTSPPLDLYFKVTWNFKKAPKEGVILKTVLRDRIKNATVSATFRLKSKKGEQSPELEGI